MEVIAIHRSLGTSFVTTGQLLLGVTDALALDELYSRLMTVEVEDEWEEQARRDLLQEISDRRQQLVVAILQGRRRREAVDDALGRFQTDQAIPLAAYRQRLEGLLSSEAPAPVMFGVVLHQLREVVPAAE
jgi:NAD-specific glutamate dehydrogenase